MEDTKGPERLSAHLRYAVTRNTILRNGEHQQKLKAIRSDHQRKGLCTCSDF